MDSAATPLVLGSGLHVAFGGRTVLSDATVEVRDGEIVTLIGPNGAGKTTLVRLLLGLEKPDRGSVVRRPGLKIGYMPQRMAFDATLPMTVGRFLALGGGDAAGRRATLEEVGTGDLFDQPVAELSSGEGQRVMLARALLRNPDLLVLDEPAQGVDVTGQADLYRLIGRIRDSRGCGVLMVSHDLHLVMAATDQVICLNHHVCCAGHPESVARDPSFLALFGAQVAETLAVYHHHHDHHHDADGRVVPAEAPAEPGRQHG